MTTRKAMSTLGVLRFVWRSSGGTKSMLLSFDFYLALVVWALSSPMWLSAKWHDQVLAVLPNLLGFTLGGFAIFLGFGSDDFKRAITHSDEHSSPYLSVNSAFLLFVTFQVAALFSAVISSALWSIETPALLHDWIVHIQYASKIGGGVGYFLFCYSLAFVLRAAIRIFRLGRWYNAYLQTPMPTSKVADAAGQVATSTSPPSPTAKKTASGKAGHRARGRR